MNVANDDGTISTCCLHSLVIKQTFSIAEMEWHLRHQKICPICESCKALFRRRINEAIDAARKVSQEIKNR